MIFFELWQYWTEKILWSIFCFRFQTASLCCSVLEWTGFLEVSEVHAWKRQQFCARKKSYFWTESCVREIRGFIFLQKGNVVKPLKKVVSQNLRFWQRVLFRISIHASVISLLACRGYFSEIFIPKGPAKDQRQNIHYHGVDKLNPAPMQTHQFENWQLSYQHAELLATKIKQACVMKMNNFSALENRKREHIPPTDPRVFFFYNFPFFNFSFSIFFHFCFCVFFCIFYSFSFFFISSSFFFFCYWQKTQCSTN